MHVCVCMWWYRYFVYLRLIYANIEMLLFRRLCHRHASAAAAAAMTHSKPNVVMHIIYYYIWLEINPKAIYILCMIIFIINMCVCVCFLASVNERFSYACPGKMSTHILVFFCRDVEKSAKTFQFLMEKCTHICARKDVPEMHELFICTKRFAAEVLSCLCLRIAKWKWFPYECVWCRSQITSK